MNAATKTLATDCQQWAAHYAKQADEYRQHATGPDCAYQAHAITYQRLAQINAATARAILAD
jgi:hypothetical protein